jgi:hypothetical protein
MSNILKVLKYSTCTTGRQDILVRQLCHYSFPNTKCLHFFVQPIQKPNPVVVRNGSITYHLLNTRRTCISCVYVWFGLWCLTPLSRMFQLYRGGQFYWCRKPKKTTDLPQVTDKHNVVSSTSRLSEVRTHNVSGDRLRVLRIPNCFLTCNKPFLSGYRWTPGRR